ncbi:MULTISPECIES: regulatory protein RecX [Vibrio]|uniref:Regulatory protein RecX n=1 Tax=Vibrio halioticoli NBRC 102217 TaxID=1219072 RepID=V5FG29_9VIBR|nr:MULTISPECIES: regulatory protein RecX [Vibrio]MPW34958.1 recombination regulator RecX [Vibrio sp. B1Z05]GAD90703.1 regulatory protein RecX [Vibrio halioticoli NBRC 102217]
MYSRSPNNAAKKEALRFLSLRDHGRYELQQKLLNKGFGLNDIDDAIVFCHEHHYLDDLRYAKDQVRLQASKGHGEHRIRQELQAKRVGGDVINQALREEPQDWFELAKLSVEKHLHDALTVDSQEYARQVRTLQFLGFSLEQIQYALSSTSLSTN